MDFKQRILDISYKRGLSHLSGCLTSVDIIASIFEKKKPDEKFVLSNGHCALALYVVLEKYHGNVSLDAEKIWEHHGTHPDRCEQCFLDCSTGSLGMGLPIAVGMALADREKDVYCLISDGECAEGSVWEALRIVREQKLYNLKIHVNINGYSALGKIDREGLITRLQYYCMNTGSEKFNVQITYHKTNVDDYPFLQGVAGHYYVLRKGDYAEIT